VAQVALEHHVLKFEVGRDQCERRRALVDLAALDADPAVLDHIDAAKAGRSRRERPRRGDEFGQLHRHPVDLDGHDRERN
jgi:hypothetical protein